MTANPLALALEPSDVIICVGSGGVGKTTVSAAIGLYSAAKGKSSLVCTIDPAKRLANALGLEALGNAEARIPESSLAAIGLEDAAPMHAMMLDMKRSWDELIEQRAAPETRAKILSSRFYQSLSSALAGSQEYIAMEKLWQLRSNRDYSLIVLDTPPTAHALDFLDAPGRILDFLDNEAARWLLPTALKAGKTGLKLFNFGGNYVARQLSKLTGAETLQELAGFMLAMSGMNDGFKERAKQTRALLAARSTSFVLVTTAAHEQLDEAVAFHALLKRRQMNVAAVVVNRVHPEVGAARFRELSTVPAGVRAKLERTLEENALLAGQDARGITELRERCAPSPLVTVPIFPLDVHDLGSLWRTAGHLFGQTGPLAGPSGRG